MANVQARADLQRLAEQQAALRRVAEHVARRAAATEVFAKVAEEPPRSAFTRPSSLRAALTPRSERLPVDPRYGQADRVEALGGKIAIASPAAP
ncbi:MAG: hypothetical protein WBP81_34070 [Solirubrobacteraceae bacterium]